MRSFALDSADYFLLVFGSAAIADSGVEGQVGCDLHVGVDETARATDRNGRFSFVASEDEECHAVESHGLDCFFDLVLQLILYCGCTYQIQILFDFLIASSDPPFFLLSNHPPSSI